MTLSLDSPRLTRFARIALLYTCYLRVINRNPLSPKTLPTWTINHMVILTMYTQSPGTEFHKYIWPLSRFLRTYLKKCCMKWQNKSCKSHGNPLFLNFQVQSLELTPHEWRMWIQISIMSWEVFFFNNRTTTVAIILIDSSHVIKCAC